MQHLAKPTELLEDYEDMVDELADVLGPHLPIPIRTMAEARATQFRRRLANYAEIDQLIGAVRRNGLPSSRGHRVYQLVDDYIKAFESRRDDPSEAA